MAAAVADYRPARPGPARSPRPTTPTALELEPTTDVLALLADRRQPGQTLVGFAAEHGSEKIHGRRGKLLRKRIDAIVVNDISAPAIGFDAPENEVTIITAAPASPVARTGKHAVARAVLDAVDRLRASVPAPPAGGMLD